jgi:uncharacterized MAPEG superfamily protein
MSNLIYIPYISLIIGVLLIYAPRMVVGGEMNKLEGGYNHNDPRSQQTLLQGLGKRALNAHHNALEALPIFGIGLVAAMQRSTSLTVIAAASAAFAVARIFYLVFYLSDKPPLRSACWGIGVLASLLLYVLALVG